MVRTYSDVPWLSIICVCSISLLTLSSGLIPVISPALRQLCDRPDAKKKTDGLTPIPQDVALLVRSYQHWDLTDQLIRFCKPLVDAIGNLESRNVSLADCMLELLRCSKHMACIEVSVNDNADFALHAKSTFNKQFLAMNTDLHWFVMFLHPQCRKLAISQVAKSRTYSDAVNQALKIAKKWNWTKVDAELLITNLQNFYHCRKPFEGGYADARRWWTDLFISGQNCPLKKMAIALFSLSPHSADVERLFSNLGSIQSVKRSRLSVEMFETLGQLRCNYVNELHKKAASEGKTLRRTTAHTHTRPSAGINELLPGELSEKITLQPIMSALVNSDDVDLLTPEGITIEEVEQAFAKLAVQDDSFEEFQGTTGSTILAAEYYNLDELESALQGNVVLEEEDIEVLNLGQEGSTWDIEALKAKAGLN